MASEAVQARMAKQLEQSAAGRKALEERKQAEAAAREGTAVLKPNPNFARPASPRHRISCLDCGAEHLVLRTDAKYCPECRLLRHLSMSLEWYARSKRCRKCKALFRPAYVRDKSLCGRCEDARVPEAERVGWGTSCQLCAEPVSPDIPVTVCRGCLKDPEFHGKDKPKKDEDTGHWSKPGLRRQERLVGALVRGQSKRQATNHATLAAIAAGQPHITKLDKETA